MDVLVVASLLAFRDTLLKQAEDLLVPAAKRLQEAKAEHHSAVIAANQLKKRANLVQSQISLSDLSMAAEQELQNSNWEEKGFTEMRLQYEDQK